MLNAQKTTAEIFSVIYRCWWRFVIKRKQGGYVVID